MIKNQWYAVLSSHQLRKGQVLGARRFGENLVFYRTMAGQIGCANSLCPHRKASLGKGRMEKDHIKCPFHGIEYDVTGKCVYIPSEGKAERRYVTVPWCGGSMGIRCRQVPTMRRTTGRSPSLQSLMRKQRTEFRISKPGRMLTSR